MTRIDPAAPAAARTPPLAPLREVVEALERVGIPCALGGSGLLVALGLADEAGDWDLTCDAPVDEAERALAGRPLQRFGGDHLHADHKLVLADGLIEVIACFAFHVGGAVCHVPTLVRGRWRGVPLGSPEAWAVAYALLGRPPKSERLFEHLARRGADPEACRRLLAEPLPAALAERLRSLAAERR